MRLFLIDRLHSLQRLYIICFILKMWADMDLIFYSNGLDTWDKIKCDLGGTRTSSCQLCAAHRAERRTGIHLLLLSDKQHASTPARVSASLTNGLKMDIWIKVSSSNRSSSVMCDPVAKWSARSGLGLVTCFRAWDEKALRWFSR